MQVGLRLSNVRLQAQQTHTKSVHCYETLEKNPAQSLTFNFPTAQLKTGYRGPTLLPEFCRMRIPGAQWKSLATYDNEYEQHKPDGNSYLYLRKETDSKDFREGQFIL